MHVNGRLSTSYRFGVVEGLKVALDFQGKTYILAFAGDSRGINRDELP